ncbi:hypothetical protein GCM10009677_02430 [Sphaerisporangium rubeum]
MVEVKAAECASGQEPGLPERRPEVCPPPGDPRRMSCLVWFRIAPYWRIPGSHCDAPYAPGDRPEAVLESTE